MVFILANPWVPGECSYELKQTALKNHTQSVNNAVKHTEGKKKMIIGMVWNCSEENNITGVSLNLSGLCTALLLII